MIQCITNVPATANYTIMINIITQTIFVLTQSHSTVSHNRTHPGLVLYRPFGNQNGQGLRHGAGIAIARLTDTMWLI